MPDYCTCGAKLVEDARFCHRCGRPTFEMPAAEAAGPAPPPPPTPAERLAQLPVGFGNPIALRIAFLLSMAIMLVGNIPVPGLIVLCWLVGGWLAVVWYRRLTGSVLTVQAGARLGSITGVMSYVTVLIELLLIHETLMRKPRGGCAAIRTNRGR